MYLLENTGLKANISADMKIVRGLDYYTGIVFEFFLPEYREIGSIGLSRLFYILNEYNLLPESSTKVLNYAIVPISENEYDYAFFVASKLREQGSSATIVLTNKKLGDKLTYAAKLTSKGIVIGESEVSSNQLQVKDFATGETSSLSLDA